MSRNGLSHDVPESASSRAPRWSWDKSKLHEGWLIGAVFIFAILVALVWSDLNEVIDSQTDIVISLAAAAIGYCISRYRAPTEKQVTTKRLVDLLRADPCWPSVPGKAADAEDKEIADSFTKAMISVLNRPFAEQPEEIRLAVGNNISSFLRSLDFTADDVAQYLGSVDDTAPQTLPVSGNGNGNGNSSHPSMDPVAPHEAERVIYTSALGASAGSELLSSAIDSSIRQFRDDHRILSHLTRVDRDIHACSQRLAEYWDQRAGSMTFPVEAPVLEVIIGDVNSAADAVTRLNRIFRNRDALLGVEPLDLGLSGLQADDMVAVSDIPDTVTAFQSASRSITEAKNRYFETLRILDPLDPSLTSHFDLSSLRIAGSDAAKALRLFRGLSYRRSMGAQRGQVIQVRDYVSASIGRLETFVDDLRNSGQGNALASTMPLASSDPLTSAALTVTVMMSDLQMGLYELNRLLAEPGREASEPSPIPVG
jgi:hypothetical protein